MAKKRKVHDRSSERRQALMTQKEYADHRGCSKQYVNQLVRKGKISLVDGKIDPVVADEALAKASDPARNRELQTGPQDNSLKRTAFASDSSPSATARFAKVRTAREHYKALRERLDYERTAGNLVSTREVEDAGFEAGRVIREAFQQSAGKIAGVVAAEFQLDERQVAKIIASHINLALNELSEKLLSEYWNIATQLGVEKE